MTNKILKNLLAYLISILVLLAIAEFGFRVYTKFTSIYSIEMHKYALRLKQKSSTPGLTHEHVPSSESILENVNIKINADGFRDVELDTKSNIEYRIMVLGSSITLGWGVPYDSVFTSIIENDLNRNNDTLNFEVINTGIGNYNTAMQSILLKEKLDKVKPDQVLLHYFVNDAEQIKAGSNSWIVKHSYLVAYFYVRVKEAIAIRQSKDLDIGNYYKDLYNSNAPGWVDAKNAIIDIKSTCEKNNLEFAVIIQPDLHDISKDSEQAKCHAVINNFLEDTKIEYLDLIEAHREKHLSNPRALWAQKDDSHPNSIGHKIIANELYKFELNILRN